ncbi:hypothetical protein JH06_1004 [Blastocystis sp. subtype 4]|uniref:hypothetical protein n=1 Tax=Blastocystis sp. subtype 4 TaxID=944170 RepID=UPI000711E27E|nr:hypothetical protein JH06_1004 [Blastocystis sp. subtype 4]KNB46149.1 hypothetical protein JH06_1004 [Blastocystis sp. subtype 4]|eukprot:XP_014529576.1 hypothetical protein JH06_1004 [Blastocystis sp. subtype 4]
MTWYRPFVVEILLLFAACCSLTVTFRDFVPQTYSHVELILRIGYVILVYLSTNTKISVIRH